MNLIDAIKSRGIEKLVVLHCDHFEPEEALLRGVTVSNIKNWMDRQIPFSGFIKHNLHTCLGDAPEGAWKTPGDKIYFKRGSPWAEHNQIFAHLAQTKDLQVHLHHETFTQNSYPQESLSEGQKKSHTYAQNRADDAADSRRVETKLGAVLDGIYEATGKRLTRWGFVHGCWALNGGDPEVCKVADEVEILMRNGCVADFSFPAGRRVCDPVRKQPFTIKPINLIRSYDSAGSSPQEWSGEIAPGRFLVWSSGRSAWNSSLDFYSPGSAARWDILINWLPQWLAFDMPVVGSTGWFKCHAHSMHHSYWTHPENPYTPLDRSAKELLPLLKAACEGAGVQLTFLTVKEIIKP